MKNFKFYLFTILFSSLFFLPAAHLSAFGGHDNFQNRSEQWQNQSENRRGDRGQNQENRFQNRDQNRQDRLLARGDMGREPYRGNERYSNEHRDMNRDMNRYGGDYHRNWNGNNNNGAVIETQQPTVIVPSSPQDGNSPYGP